MHVLYLHQHFSTPRGAAGTRSYEMARRLIARGHEVTMVCGSYGGGDTGLDAKPAASVRRGVVDGINVVEFCLPYSNKDGFMKRSWTFLQFALKGLRLALKERYDLLFATSTPLTAGIPGICMKLLVGDRPFVFEVRDLWPELPREMGVITNPLILQSMSLLEWLSYRSADSCIGLSPGIVRGIERRGISSSRVFLVPNGCDLELFRPVRRPSTATVSPGKQRLFRAIFTGAHGMANGLDAVLDAARVLKEKGRGDIELVFVGDGKLKPSLVDRASREGLDNCVFRDPIPKTDLADVIATAGAGLMILANCPAFYYGTSPNKFFDYIAAGLPVICNYPGWIADLIREHECGLAVEPENAESLAAALVALADHPERCVDMGGNARRLAKAQFSREELAGRLVDVLEETLAKFLTAAR